MPKTALFNTTSRRVRSRSKQAQTPFPAMPIKLLWAKYQTALTKKRRLLALHLHDGRLEPLYEGAYDVLSDLAEAILKAGPTCEFDRSIQAEIIVRRERDLGGPCMGAELLKFCRDIQIGAGFLSPLEARP